MNEKEIISQIEELLDKNHLRDLRKYLNTLNPYDVAQVFDDDDFTKEEMVIVFRLLDKDMASDSFVELEPDRQEQLVKAFSDRELRDIMDSMFVDDIADIVDEMPANVAKRVLKNADSETRKAVNKILKYPDDSAGSIMTTEIVTLRREMTVIDALKRIKETGVNKETIYTCYVTDKGKRLIGMVSAKDILLAEPEQIISDIMETNVIYVNTVTDQEEVVRIFDNYDFLALPVVDREKRLIGIITVDDAIDVMVEESTEDMEKMAAIMPSDDTYFNTSILTHAKNRIFWLLFLMLSATMSQAVLNHYETAFAALPILVGFIPMLTGTGGNCGSQSSTMIIRGLSLEEIEVGDIVKVMMKEAGIGAMVGVMLAIVNGIRIMIFYHNFTIALVLGLTLIITAILAKLVGCTLPIIAKCLKIDPAVMAAPLISTILDTCTMIVYFTIAVNIMNI